MDYNMANRRVCDVDIKVYKTGANYLLIDTANTTTQGITGETVYALARGVKRIGFDEPNEGTMTIEAQVLPFKIYAMLSDGTIYSDAVFAAHEKIKATTAGQLTLKDTPDGGTVYVYANGDWAGTAIAGSASGTTFTATTEADIAVDSIYEVGYVVKRTTGVKRVSFGSNFEAQDYSITMSTLDKDERGVLTPVIYKAYKAHPNRTLELSQSSTGDPATLTLNFDLLEDSDGNFVDIIEDTTNAE